MKRARGRQGFTIGELLLVFIIVFLVAALMLPIIRFNRVRMDRITCSNNLREIGLAMYIYAREHDGSFPPSLKAVYAEQYLSDTRLVDCPASRHVGTPEDPDYIYTAGLTVKAPSTDVLIRDRSDNHPGGGKNVLYVNGAITWLEE